MRNILVTGGCGFIGSNFINYMLDTYKDVFIVNIDRLDYCANVKNVYHKERYQLVVSDLNKYSIVRELLNQYNIQGFIMLILNSVNIPALTKANQLGHDKEAPLPLGQRGHILDLGQT